MFFPERERKKGGQIQEWDGVKREKFKWYNKFNVQKRKWEKKLTIYSLI